MHVRVITAYGKPKKIVVCVYYQFCDDAAGVRICACESVKALVQPCRLSASNRLVGFRRLFGALFKGVIFDNSTIKNGLGVDEFFGGGSTGFVFSTTHVANGAYSSRVRVFRTRGDEKTAEEEKMKKYTDANRIL